MCVFCVLQGVTKFLKYGIIVEILRTMIRDFSVILTNPFEFLATIGSRVKFNILCFLVGYVGINRVAKLPIFTIFFYQFKYFYLKF